MAAVLPPIAEKVRPLNAAKTWEELNDDNNIDNNVNNNINDNCNNDNINNKNDIINDNNDNNACASIPKILRCIIIMIINS